QAEKFVTRLNTVRKNSGIGRDVNHGNISAFSNLRGCFETGHVSPQAYIHEDHVRQSIICLLYRVLPGERCSADYVPQALYFASEVGRDNGLVFDQKNSLADHT